MPPYDSESSDESDDYTETNVLLGYAADGATSDPISHIGGQAVSIANFTSKLVLNTSTHVYQTWIDDKTAPSGALAKCKVCNGFLTLLLELNGDLPEHFPGHERRLYIWSCRNKACSRKEGSVRGIRGVKVAKVTGTKVAQKKQEATTVQPEVKPLGNIGGSLFGVNNETSMAAPMNPFANPFSMKSNGNPPTNPFSSPSALANPFSTTTPAVPATSPETKDEPEIRPKEANPASSGLSETFASKVRLSSPPIPSQLARPHEPWPAASAFPPAYPPYSLDAEYETLDAPSTPQIPSNVRVDMDADGGGVDKDNKEVFESSMDKTFQKFADRVGENPEQVLRYEFQGEPLLYSDIDAVGKMLAPHSELNAKVKAVGSKTGSGIPRCENCGADRVFEVQLMPHAITELEAEEMSMDGMEWGTVILGVCSKDCHPHDVREGEVGYLEEWVGVQWEEVTTNRGDR